jgi:hypothetical protein
MPLFPESPPIDPYLPRVADMAPASTGGQSSRTRTVPTSDRFDTAVSELSPASRNLIMALSRNVSESYTQPGEAEVPDWADPLKLLDIQAATMAYSFSVAFNARLSHEVSTGIKSVLTS